MLLRYRLFFNLSHFTCIFSIYNTLLLH